MPSHRSPFQPPTPTHQFTEWYIATKDEWLLRRRPHKSAYALDATGEADDPYSDRQLLARASLTFDPAVRAVIDEFWDIVNWEDHVEKRLRSHGQDAKISKHAMRVSKPEYMEFNMNLQRHVAMHGGDLTKGDAAATMRKARAGGKTDASPDGFDEEAAARIAEREWEFDCLGRDTLSYDEFFMSIFQLMDAWAEGLDADAYSSFMTTLIEETTAVQHLAGTDGQTLRGWKWVSDHRLEDERAVEARLKMEEEEEKDEAGAEAEAAVAAAVAVARPVEPPGKSKATVEPGVGFNKGSAPTPKSPPVSNRQVSMVMRREAQNVKEGGANVKARKETVSPVRAAAAAAATTAKRGAAVDKKTTLVKEAKALRGKKVDVVGTGQKDLDGRRGVAKQADEDGNVEIELEPDVPAPSAETDAAAKPARRRSVTLSAANLIEITPAQEKHEAQQVKKATRLVGR